MPSFVWLNCNKNISFAELLMVKRLIFWALDYEYYAYSFVLIKHFKNIKKIEFHPTWTGY